MNRQKPPELPDIKHLKVRPDSSYTPRTVVGLLRTCIGAASGRVAKEILGNALIFVIGLRDTHYGANLNFVCADHYLENCKHTATHGPLGRPWAIARTYGYDLLKDSPAAPLLKKGPGPLSESSPLARRWALVGVDDGIKSYALGAVKMSDDDLRRAIYFILIESAKRHFDYCPRK